MAEELNPFGGGAFGDQPFGPGPEGGGTNYTQAVMAGIGAGANLSLEVSKVVMVVAEAAADSAKAVSFTVAAAAGISALAVKAVGFAVLTAASLTGGVMRGVLKHVSSDVALSASQARQTDKNVFADVSADTAPNITKAVSFVVAATASISASAVRAVGFAVTVAANLISGVMRGVLKSVGSDVALGVTQARQIGKAVSTSVSAVGVQLPKAIAFAVMVSAQATVLTARNISLHVVPAVASIIGVVTKLAGKHVAASVTARSLNLRDIFRKAVRYGIATVGSAMRGGAALLRSGVAVDGISGIRTRGGGVRAGRGQGSITEGGTGSSEVE